jgi:hypothetical protein
LWPLLLVAAVLRFYGPAWDGGIGAHPDERHVVGVAERLGCVQHGCPNGLNPFALAPDYAYGHVPLYLLAVATRLLGGVDPLLVGRALAALFGLGTVALTFVLGRRIYGRRVGLGAAAFVAVMVLHVQQAHFYTVDALLPFFVLGTLLFAVRLAQGDGTGRWSFDAWLAGAWAGLALGTKLSAAFLALPVGAALCTLEEDRWKAALRSGGGALAAFAVTNPFALLAFPVFWRNVAEQAAMARGALDLPYTRQFHGTWPYVYPLVQQLRWGMGWPLGLLACGGLAQAVWRAIKEPPSPGERVLLAWVVPFLAFVGALYAKFPRYLLPLTPLLALYAARTLSPLSPGPLSRARRTLALSIAAGVWVASFLLCLAVVNVYRFPHPWQTASAWFRWPGRGPDRVPGGAVVAVEQWDHPLPLETAGYEVRELPVFDEDTPEKWAAMVEGLAGADYVVIASRRGYAALARWPERYPLTADYYEQLFNGGLGFRPVACFGRAPRLGPVALVDDPAAGLDFSLPGLCRPDVPVVLRLGRLDESFVVYDHPQVVILERSGSLPPAGEGD